MGTVKSYLPRKQAELNGWLENFLERLTPQALTVGFTEQEVADVFDPANAVRQAYADLTARKNDMEAAVTNYYDKLEAMQERLGPFVQNMKSRSLYTDAIGEMLGIVAPPVSERNEAKAPVLQLVMQSDEVHIKFKKGGTA